MTRILLSSSYSATAGKVRVRLSKWEGDMSVKDFTEMEAVESVRLIAFDRAQIVGGFAGQYFLIVSGQAPCSNMQVELAPRIYITCPDYWAIEVVGSLPGAICLEALSPFTRFIELDGITGSKGIEVIGHNRVQRFKVSGGCDADGETGLQLAAKSIPCPFRDGGARDWKAWLDTMPGPDGNSLIVTAVVETEPGYTGKISFTYMDRAWPPNQHAELNLIESAGAPGGCHEIRETLETNQQQFNSVVIHCHGEELVTITPVPVVS